MNKMDEKEIKITIERYNERYKEFGYSPKTLGWLKGKQDIRFDILTSLYNCENKTILDIGCGFGDLNKTLRQKTQAYQYIGCDLCENLIKEGRELYPDAHFYIGDFLKINIMENVDWCIASGPFNHKFEKEGNYDFIKSVMKKAYEISKDGFSFDFISDKVDYKDEHIFYATPEKILSFAYELSRNVVLRSDYMPFEFSIFVFKDDSFEKSDTIFKKYKNDKNIWHISTPNHRF